MDRASRKTESERVQNLDYHLVDQAADQLEVEIVEHVVLVTHVEDRVSENSGVSEATFLD